MIGEAISSEDKSIMATIIISSRCSGHHQHQPAASTPIISHTKEVGERQSPPVLDDFIFGQQLRILFQYLERVDKEALHLARRVLKDFEQRYNVKDASMKFDYTLAAAVNEEMRTAVGKVHWDKACRIQKRVISNRQDKSRAMMMKTSPRKTMIRIPPCVVSLDDNMDDFMHHTYTTPDSYRTYPQSRSGQDAILGMIIEVTGSK